MQAAQTDIKQIMRDFVYGVRIFTSTVPEDIIQIAYGMPGKFDPSAANSEDLLLGVFYANQDNAEHRKYISRKQHLTSSALVLRFQQPISGVTMVLISNPFVGDRSINILTDPICKRP